jgi:fibronectin type 3 domain-containing protein
VTAGGTTTYGAFKTVSSYTQVGGIAVKVESTAKGKATLSWDKNTSVGGYEIYRSTSKNGTYSKVAVIPTNAQTSYTEKGLTSGKTYYYKMRAYKKMGGSYVYGSLSNALSVTVK